MRFTILVLLFFAVCCHGDAGNRPVVETPLGKVRGYYKESLEKRQFAAFEGIPFAKPPVGKRRFQPPEAVKAWKGVWEADTLHECVQASFMPIPNLPPFSGHEDCLYINVYVPRTKINPKDNLEVIVQIHGGAFMIGSGHSYTHPDYLMDRDVIFVSFNYRLGFFGFLSTQDDVVPGNNGLKDQAVALKWIQQNIASFGGNPNSVTITGLSAGAMSVHLHYMSKWSKNLFHRGFSECGSAPMVISSGTEQLARVKKLARLVGCPESPSKDLVKCLRQRPYQVLIKVLPQLYDYKIAPVLLFGPVVERGSNPFLDDVPYNKLKRGEIQDLPWLLGNSAHEGLLIPMLFPDMKEINDRWEETSDSLLMLSPTTPKGVDRKAIANKVREFYLRNQESKDFDESTFLQYVQMFSDRFFLTASDISLKLQSVKNKSPVYYFIFSYPGDNSPNGMVGHGNEAQYFFAPVLIRRPHTENELKMKDICLDFLVSFAKTGVPKIKGVNWPPTKSATSIKYLNISSYEPEGLQVQEVNELTPREFWDSLGLLEEERLPKLREEL